MADRVLPSREELETSDKDVWTHALEVALQHFAMDLTTAGVLGHIRHLIVTGRLVDREAIDYEAATDAAVELLTVEPVWDDDASRIVVEAALRRSDG